MSKVKIKLYLIEDSPFFSATLRAMLTKIGVQVVGSTPTAELDIQEIIKCKPNIILSDIYLDSGLTGIDLAERILQHIEIPIVFITGNENEDDFKKAVRFAPYGYLVKPVNMSTLSSTLQLAVQKFRMEQDLRLRENSLRTLLDAFDEFVIILNDKQEIEYMNTVAKDFFNWRHLKEKNVQLSQVAHFYSPKGKEISVQKLLSTNLRSPYFEVKALLANDKLFAGQLFVKEIKYKSAPTQWVLKFSDVSSSVQKERIKTQKQKEWKKYLIEGQENERKRIAKELHDGVGQMLSALQMHFDKMIRSKNLDITNIRQFKYRVKDVITEIKHISENLYPDYLNKFSLEENIHSLVSHLNEISEASIELIVIDCPQVNNAAHIHLYRMVQEALNNAIKYSNATEITVQVLGLDGQIRIMVEDNGVGFDLERMAHNHGFGLNNMKQRADLLSGAFTIESNPNFGTSILIDIPLDAKIEMA